MIHHQTNIPNYPSIYTNKLINPDFCDGVAIIGSLHLSDIESEWILSQTLRAIAAGYTIVTGNAIGADTIGASQALLNKSRLISVLPHSLDWLDWARNQQLNRDCMASDTTLLLSPFKQGTKLVRANFLYRNGLVAQFSKYVIAVNNESHGGGTGNTINHALKLKRPVRLYDTSGTTWWKRLPNKHLLNIIT
jgi:DNA processing protein